MEIINILNRQDEIESLRQQLDEANAAIEAIRSGQVNAF